MRRRCPRPPICVGWALLVAACTDAGPEPALFIEAPSSTRVTVGDFLQLSVTSSGASPLVTWASSNNFVADVSQGRVEAKRPGPVTITVSADGVPPAEIALTVEARPGGYTTEEVDYFVEIAFGAEFGTNDPLLRRWPSGPLIDINGTPTTGDLEVVDSVIAEVNRVIPGFGMGLDAVAPTVEMHFLPQANFTDVLPNAPAGNNGLVWIWWGADQYVFQAVILISTDATQLRRDHVIREETTQLLGLLNDSFLYPQSIFYQSVSDVTAYQPIDRVVIELLHRPELTVGMTIAEASQVARTLTRVAPGAGYGSPSLRQPRTTPFRGKPGSAGSGSVSPTRFPLPGAPAGGSR